ncbi:MAG: S-layer homology domain-containing protein [Bacillota bacterium]
MLKRVFGLLFLGFLAFLFLATPAVAASSSEIADVPPEHWAYQAVKQLVAQGYLGLYPDNTFRGNQPVDRYTLAVVVARLLNEALGGKTTLSKEDADLLRRLTGEFRQELVALSMRTKTLEEALARYESEQKALGADLAGTTGEAAQARAQLAAAAREILALKERVARLEEELAKVADETKENTAALKDTATLVETQQKDLATLTQRVALLEDELRTWKYIAAGIAILAGLLL